MSRQRLVRFAIAGAQARRPLGMHTAKDALLQRSVWIQLDNSDLHRLECPMLSQTPGVLCQVTRQVAEQRSAVLRLDTANANIG